MAVVLITHDMGVIAGRTDRVVVMYAGKVAEEAETGELFGRIRHPYSEALLASVPKLDQSRDERLLSIPGLPPDLSKTIVDCRFAPRCQFATDECRTEEPPLTSDADATARWSTASPASTRSTPTPGSTTGRRAGGGRPASRPTGCSPRTGRPTTSSR